MAASAADLGAPTLSPSLPVRDYFDTGKMLKAGVRLEQNANVVIEPQLGLGHARREREIRTGYDDVTHTIHARAGGQVHLFRVLSLSASAKLPVYSVESSDQWIAGSSSQSVVRRYGYEIMRPAGNLSWTGEMGFNLSGHVDLKVFYDQNRFDMYPRNGETHQEDRFGTRLIFRFR